MLTHGLTICSQGNAFASRTIPFLDISVLWFASNVPSRLV